MLWVGRLSDQFRIRVLGAFVILGLAAACIFLVMVKSWFALVIAIFFLRFFGQGMSSHLASVAMTRWFIATRGRALAIATLGFSVGEALLPMICVALLVYFDWQTVWLCAAGLCLFAIPLLRYLLSVERTPASLAQEQSSTGMLGLHWSRIDALKHGLFWTMLPWVAAPSAFGTAFFFQQVPFAAEKGFSHLQLVSLFPLYTGTAVLSMLVFGGLIDRFSARQLAAFFQLPFVLAFLIFSSAQSLFGVALGLIAMGVASGGNATVPTAFWAEFYGTRSIGAIKATAAAAMVFGSAVGPALSGIGLEWNIALGTQYFSIAFVFLGVSLIVFCSVQYWGRSLTANA